MDPRTNSKKTAARYHYMRLAARFAPPTPASGGFPWHSRTVAQMQPLREDDGDAE